MDSEYQDFVVISLERATDEVHFTATKGNYDEYERIINQISSSIYRPLYTCFGLNSDQSNLVDEAIIPLDGKSYKANQSSVDSLVTNLQKAGEKK